MPAALLFSTHWLCGALHGALNAPALLSDPAHPRDGRFVIGGESHPLSLRRLPCVVESFKTYDDINFVKTTDVGEVAPVQRIFAQTCPLSLPAHQPTAYPALLS